MRKEIEFIAKVDTSEIDKAIEGLQRKMREAYRSQDNVGAQRQTAGRLEGMGMGGIMSKPTMDAYQRSIQQSRREMDQLIAAEAKGQEKLAKEIVKRAEAIKKLREEQKAATGDVQKELEIREKLTKAEENQYKLREHYKQRDDNLNQAMDARQKMSPQGMSRLMTALDKGGLSGMGTAAGRMAMQNPGAAMGIAGSALGGISSMVGMGSALYGQIALSPYRAQVSSGNAAQGIIGNQANDMGTAYGQAFMKERNTALQSAKDISDVKQKQDQAGVWKNLLAITGGLAIIGGSALGALPSGGATLLGAGAGVGMVGAGVNNLMGNQRSRSNFMGQALEGTADVMSGLPGFNLMSPKMREWAKGQREEYSTTRMEDFAKDFSEQFEAEKNAAPLKKLAAQDYGDNWQQYLDTQRALGLQGGEFHGEGGFRDQARYAGFTDLQSMGMSSNILAAGGSTMGARDSAFGLQMQRAGLTNAGGILGSISGQMGGSEATRQSTIKIMSEAMRIGLDDSRFAEENRRFTQTVAGMVAASGTKSAEQAGTIAGQFGNFVADNTMGGLKGAQAAYQQYQDISSTTTGPRGTMRAAGFLRNDTLSKLPMSAKQALMQLPEDQLDPNNPQIMATAMANGIDPQQMVDEIKKVNRGSYTRYAKTDEAMARLRAAGVDPSIRRSQEDMKKLTKENVEDIATVSNLTGVDLGTLGTEGNLSRLHGMYTGTYKQDETGIAREAEQKNKLEGKQTGRVEDQTVQNLAEERNLVVSSFRAFKDQLVPTTENIKQFNQQMVELNNNWKKISRNLTSDQMDKVSSGIGVRTQPQPGAPKN